MRQLLRLGVLLGLVAAIGCGSHARTTITGKVTVGGKGPLTGGAIQFVLASDPTIIGGGTIKGDGAYEVTNAPLGECNVVIETEYLSGKQATGIPTIPGMTKGPPKDMSKKMGDGPPTGVEGAGTGTSATAGVKYMKIDSAYATKEKTPLKSTVSRGSASPSDFDVK